MKDVALVQVETLKRKKAEGETEEDEGEEEEDEEGEAIDGNAKYFPNMQLDETIAAAIRDAPLQHTKISHTKLKNHKSMGQCKCKMRCSYFCVQCTFIKHLPNKIVYVCGNCTASHDSAIEVVDDK